MTINQYDFRMMYLPSYVKPFCVVCCEPAVDKHHVIKRSHGGGRGPQVSLCRKHHNLAHDKGLLRFSEGSDCGGKPGKLYHIITYEPMKIQDAHKLTDWMPVEDLVTIFDHYWSQQ